MSNYKTTKNAKGAGTIRKRSDGRWEARYSIGFGPKTGKQVQKSVYGKTQKEVRQKLTKVSSEIDEGTYIEPCKMKLNEWLDIWLADYLNGVKDSTAYLYQRRIALYLRPALGTIRLDQLDSHTIQHLYNSLGKDRDDKKGLSAKTVKNVHGILHEALKQAVLLGYIRYNPTEACVLPRAVKKDIRPLTDEQTTLFLNAIQDSSYRLLFMLYLFTGMRECELLGLMWDCVDFEKGTILINKQLNKSQRKGGAYQFTPPKNGISRKISPAPFVMNLLREQQQIQARQRNEAGSAWQESGLVFTTELGRYVSYRALYDSFKRIMNAIGLPNARIHDLRHTYAVNSIRAGDDIKTVQENLGHATAAFTLDFYGHYTDDMRRASSNRMEAFISNVLKL